MERQYSEPNKFIGKRHLGFVINAAFSGESSKTISNWLDGLNQTVPEGIYTMPQESLHITVLDWIAPLFDLGGVDKRKLFEKLSPEFDRAFTNALEGLKQFQIRFEEIRITPGTIILVGQDNGQFQKIRNGFTKSITYPQGSKQPPTIIHSSIARFAEPSVDIRPVQEYAAQKPLIFTQTVDSFRLIETTREPMQDFSVIKTYELSKTQ